MSQSQPTTGQRVDESVSEQGTANEASGQADNPRIQQLEAENRRLREGLAIAHRNRYRQSAAAMAGVGFVALLGAVVFPNVRTVLVALGGTGFFGAVLTYFLTPERFVAANISQRVYGTLADNEAAIVDDLDLQGDPHIVPATGRAEPARLFIPVDSATPVPESIEDPAPLRVGEPKGIAVEPTGTPLYELLIHANGSLPGTVDGIAVTVADALTDQFELIDVADVDTEPGRATLAVSDSAFGAVDRFDHPVVSLFSTTLAIELERPVRIGVSEAEQSDGWLITCRWVTDSASVANPNPNTDLGQDAE